MIDFVDRERPPLVAMITECSMSDNVAREFPDIDFVRPCNLCPHMKKITLANIRDCLEHMEHRVRVPAEVAERARRSVERMLEIGRGTTR
jgi:quinolinate synthase